MRDLLKRPVAQYRIDATKTHGWNGDANGGMFVFPSPEDARALRAIASAMDGWDHVSVSHADRCPTWYEMDYAKRLFFAEHEVAFQLHPAISDYINCHPRTLHLWRPHNQPIPLPPKEFV